jgi:hypothetical protein
LNEQLSEREHNLRDTAALVKRLETEKVDLQSAIEEADTALESNEVRLQRAAQEQADQRSEVDRHLADKEAEFETTRYPSLSSSPFPHSLFVSYVYFPLYPGTCPPLDLFCVPCSTSKILTLEAQLFSTLSIKNSVL